MEDEKEDRKLTTGSIVVIFICVVLGTFLFFNLSGGSSKPLIWLEPAFFTLSDAVLYPDS